MRYLKSEYKKDTVKAVRFNKQDIEDLETLAEITGAETLSDCIRNAIKFHLEKVQ